MEPRDIEFFGTILDWTKQHVRIEHVNREVYFYERGIWWANLGQNIGSEVHGKNIAFERPVIILKKFSKRSFLGVPLTSKIRSGSWYFNFDCTGNRRCVLLTQIRNLSAKRLIRKKETMSPETFETLRTKLKALI